MRIVHEQVQYITVSERGNVTRSIHVNGQKQFYLCLKKTENHVRKLPSSKFDYNDLEIIGNLIIYFIM